MKYCVIDTDTAGDDVTSIIIGSLLELNIVGITTVAGNVPVALATKNALLTLEKVNRSDIPVFQGADKPLLRDLVTAQYVHGDDGMGNSNFEDPVKRPEQMNAAIKLVDFAREYSGNIIICAQAPLTNIALATMIDRHFSENVEHLYIMGGTFRHSGNITPAAEYNFYVDPEAADIVLHAGFNITILPWDVCISQTTIGMNEINEQYRKNKNALFKFYLDVNRSAIEYNKSGRSGILIDGLTHSDSVLMSLILDSTIIEEIKNVNIDISKFDELTRGFSSMCIDSASNIKVITKVNSDKFKEILFNTLAKGTKFI